MRPHKDIETTNHSWKHDESYRNALLQNKKWGAFFAEKVKHDVSQDTLIGEIDFSSMFVPPRTHNLIGRELIPVINVTEPTTKFPVMLTSDLGKTTKQGKGLTSYASGTGRLTYKELKIGDSYNTADRVNQEFIEDAQMGALTYYWQELHRAHKQTISQLFLDQITGVATSGTATDPSGNVYTGNTATAKTASQAFSLDSLIEGWTEAQTLKFMPDCLLLNPVALSTLLKDDDFKSNEYMQEYANYDSGMISSILGMNIFVSNQIPSNANNNKRCWMFEKDQFAVCAMRRDEMITNIEDNNILEQGLSISSRLGFAYKDPSRCVVLTGK